MSTSDWVGFWKGQRDAFNTIMKINTSYFAGQLSEKFIAGRPTRLLDYGCGPGLLEDALVTENISITGVDINASFISQCKLRHPSSQFIQISADALATKRILEAETRNKKFDLIILLSVVQYFKDLDEVEAVLNMLHGLTPINGKVILADIIDDRTHAIRDTLSLLTRCVRENRIWAFFKFISYLLTSDYRKLSGSARLLAIPHEAISRIASKQGFDLAIMEGLTIHVSRTNYILTKI